MFQKYLKVNLHNQLIKIQDNGNGKKNNNENNSRRNG